MNQLRFLIIGIVFGGGFGAKTGAYFAQVFNAPFSLELIEFGFLLGAGLGLFVSITFQLMNAVAFKPHESTLRKPPVAAFNT